MGWGEGGCESRIEVFWKIQKKKKRGVGGGWVRSLGSGWVGQDGCERGIEVFVKIKKKNIFFAGGGGLGERSDGEGIGGRGRVGGSGWM